MESYLNGKSLIGFEKWKKFVDKTIKRSSISSWEQEIYTKLEKSVIDRSKVGKIGILFSGGIDSTSIIYFLIKNHISFIPICVGFYDKKIEGLLHPDDIDFGQMVAKKMNFTLIKKILDLDDVEKVMKKVLVLLGEELFDVPNTEVGMVEYVGLKKAKELECNIIFSGLGSEELFAGYQRHEKVNDINKECLKGIIEIYNRDLKRINKISNYFGINIATPFLDISMIKLFMQIPNEFKIKNGFSKYCLRKSLESTTIPKEVVWRKKRAAQYGSRFDSAIIKLSRRAGFTFKKQYLRKILRENLI